MQERKETLYVRKPVPRGISAWYESSWTLGWITCKTTGRWMLDEYDNLFLEVKYMLPVYEQVSFIERCMSLFQGPHWKKIKDKEVIAYEYEGLFELRKDKVYFTCGETE